MIAVNDRASSRFSYRSAGDDSSDEWSLATCIENCAGTIAVGRAEQSRVAGADEDAQGEPFVGRAGQLLPKILKAMGFARGDVYIANILKCRPDTPAGSFGNRAPTPMEMQTCRPYLVEQIEIIQPKVLVALGAVAVEGLLGMRGTMRELRGRWHAYNGIPLMITYHPAYLLRYLAPSEKRKV